MHSSSPARAPKLKLVAEQPWAGECWIPPKKDTPRPRAKEKPQKDGRKGEIAFRIKPHIHQRHLEGSNKTLCAPGPRRKEQWPHKRLTQPCPWVSSNLQQRCGSGVACSSVRGTECGSACTGPFEGGHHYLHYLHHSLVSGQTTGREQSPTQQ